MTNAEILEKAINKAIEGGWDPSNRGKQVAVTKTYGTTIMEIVSNWKHLWTLESIIFNHEFAKALWGEDHDCGAGYHKQRETMHIPERKLSDGSVIPAKEEEINLDYVAYCLHGTQKNWQYHLQQMVIAPDPIKYLADNLDF